MNSAPLVYYDSGIGGLCYGLHFHSRNPEEKLICVADRAHFPYGMKSRAELIALASSLTEKIIAKYRPKIMAVACNAASVSALAALRERFPGLSIVGTVPAIKPAVLASKKRCVGVLGTLRTNSDPYIAGLVSRYGPDCRVEGIAAPELAEFMEHRWLEADETEKLETAASYITRFREKGVDTVVLACTHYPLLKDEFLAAAGSDIAIFDSLEGITGRVESLLDADNRLLRAKAETRQQTVMAVSGGGALEPYWEKLAGRFHLVLERI